MPQHYSESNSEISATRNCPLSKVPADRAGSMTRESRTIWSTYWTSDHEEVRCVVDSKDLYRATVQIHLRRKTYRIDINLLTRNDLQRVKRP